LTSPNCALVSAVIETGTLCSDSERFWAVTTISSIPELTSVAGAVAALTRPGESTAQMAAESAIDLAERVFRVVVFKQLPLFMYLAPTLALTRILSVRQRCRSSASCPMRSGFGTA
jgi:hypothetical protein